MAFPLHGVFLALAGVIFLPQAQGQCDFGWRWYADIKSCYYFSDKSVTWNHAAILCRNFGGYLTDIITIYDNEFIRQEMVINKAFYVWVGGHKTGRNMPWLWEDKTQIGMNDFINWAWHHPRSDYNTQMCMKIERNDGQWIDDKCSEKRMYVCKKGAKPKKDW